MKKTIRDFSLKGKKVIIRGDFNVPLKGGIIVDDNRLKESLETIRYALKEGARLILMSHLGRIKTKEDKINNSLLVVSKRLGELLEQEVIFIDETRGSKLELMINNLKNGEVLLMENTRFEDVPNKLESNNDLKLATYWASLGDLFINDAFGTCHRAHASNVGIAGLLPSGLGFLVEKEITMMEDVITRPQLPFTVILGGAKVNDKIGVIKNLVKKANYILIGGGMAFTFLKAKGFEVGQSIVDVDSLNFCKEILKDYDEKIVLPKDIVCSKEIKEKAKTSVKLVNEISQEDIGLDIGPQTITLFNKYLKKSKTVIWNGPMGIFEIKAFAKGTESLAEILANLKITTIIGGGDTAAAMIKMGYQNAFTHLSTGGGASLEMLEGKSLPGIDIINNKE